MKMDIPAVRNKKIYWSSNTPLEFIPSSPTSCGLHCNLGFTIITSCNRLSEPPNRKSNPAVPCPASAAFLSLGRPPGSLFLNLSFQKQQTKSLPYGQGCPVVLLAQDVACCLWTMLMSLCVLTQREETMCPFR